MNLEDVKTIIKNLIIPAAFIVTLILVGSWWLFSKEPRAEEKFGRLTPVEITSIVPGRTNIRNQVEIKNPPKFPRVVPVYKKTPLVEKEEIVKDLSFTGKPRKIVGQLLWTSGSKTLRFKLPTSRFIFFDSRKIAGKALAEEEALKAATEKLSGLGLVKDDKKLKITSIKRLFVAGQNAEEAKPGQKFNIHSVSFGLNLNSLAVLNENADAELANVWIGADASLQKLEADTQPLIVASSSTYKIKSLKEASKEVREGEGVIVNTSRILGQSDVTYKQVELAYFLGDTNEKYFQPVFLFKGTTVSLAGKYVEVKTMIPALVE